MIGAPSGASAPGARVAFLVGAGRSGTTLLQKLLCLHPGVAYISNYEQRCGWLPDGLACGMAAQRIDDKLAAWFDQGGNAYFIRRPLLKRLMPTPHEGEFVFQHCGMPLFPPPDYAPAANTTDCLRRRFERFRQRAGATIFLSKRTANNRRIGALAQIFPAARYLHLVRDGREVTQSLADVEWWDGHPLWWDGRKPPELESAGMPRLQVCARNWVRELQEIRHALAAVDARRQLELRFEELLRDPVTHLERLTGFLGLDFPAAYHAAIDSLQLRPGRSRWARDWSPEQLSSVLAEAGPLLRELGYPE